MRDGYIVRFLMSVILQNDKTGRSTNGNMLTGNAGLLRSWPPRSPRKLQSVPAPCSGVSRVRRPLPATATSIGEAGALVYCISRRSPRVRRRLGRWAPPRCATTVGADSAAEPGGSEACARALGEWGCGAGAALCRGAGVGGARRERPAS